ncbi:hypothetical protein B484DRAFT_454334 [Ochromonadaceae sp. CCMP2298]|nr:hypothetical protein B484DRAFT_454334 [Ochromonadaceae sp. CCMP2298]|mmetsp:Transcript_15383/g.33935  ORF Transcript_15383/g.33935 Transcript_15383/m.33935 type:complete len:216 (+) Transcript_15383:148-795(+)
MDAGAAVGRSSITRRYGYDGRSGMGATTDSIPLTISGRASGRIVATLGTGDHNSFLGYAIAIITLGAAVGNMFLAGKIRNLMKIKVPTPANWKSPNPGNAGKTSKSAKDASARRQQQQQAEAEAIFKAFKERLQASAISSELEQSLSVLELPGGSAPSSEALKEAYRVAMLKYHPDRNRDQSVEVRRVTAVRFKQSQEAYDSLQAFLRRSSGTDS